MEELEALLKEIKTADGSKKDKLMKEANEAVCDTIYFSLVPF